MKTHPFHAVCKHGENPRRHRPKPLASNGETVTALGAAGADDRAAAARLHADEKAVRALAADDGRLVSAFHDALACAV